jgi:AmmeMemoRadiSam system protein A
VGAFSFRFSFPTVLTMIPEIREVDMTVLEKRSGEWSPGLTAAEQETLFTIAMDTLKWCVLRSKAALDLERYPLTAGLLMPRATFVTLHEHGMLRGCIGSLQPEAPLYQSVHENAERAALHDPRFPPVGPRDLPLLRVDVSILSPILPIAGPADFHIGEHGIILAKGFHRAVYLPEVAPEQGWTVEETLDSLSAKAGLPPDAWRSGASFQVFSSVVLSTTSTGEAAC